jgi:hypothetical protein
MVQISNRNGFIFTPEDMAEPLGNNGLSAFAAMFQRTLYKDKLYPSPVYAARPLDTWYKRNLFGRLDAEQNTVIPQTANLVQIPNAKEPLFALNFVSDAFGKFIEHMANATMTRAVTLEGNPDIIKPNARRAYQDPTQQYNEFHGVMSKQFIKSFQPPPSNPIDNFQTFIKYYASFLKNMVPYFPITKTSYVLSYEIDPMCTGLSIGIANANPADDKTKYYKFIDDPNFEFYTRVAKKFGFVVDKHQPWILTADLFSPALMAHVDNYIDGTTGDRITRDNFFSVYYTPTYQDDINDLAGLFVSGYRNLVGGSPLYQREHICPQTDKFSYKNLNRQPYDKRDILSELDPQFLIDLYVDLRQLESQNSYTPGQVARLKRSIYEIYSLKMPSSKLAPLQRVAQEVNFRYRKYIYPANISRLTGVSPDSAKTAGSNRRDSRKLKK